MSRTKTIVAGVDSLIPAVNLPVVAQRKTPASAIAAWATEVGADATLQKTVQEGTALILQDCAKLRQTFYDMGTHLIQIREKIGSSANFSKFMTIVLPTTGISRNLGYSCIGRVETLFVKFPNARARAFIADSTNGRSIISSQEYGKLTPEANKVLEEMGRLPEDAPEAKALEYAATFVARVKAMKSTPDASGSRKKTGNEKFDKASAALEKKVQNYASGISRLAAIDTHLTADALGKDIQFLFAMFLTVAGRKSGMELLEGLKDVKPIPVVEEKKNGKASK